MSVIHHCALWIQVSAQSFFLRSCIQSSGRLFGLKQFFFHFLFYFQVAFGSELTNTTQLRNINEPTAHNAETLLRTRAALFELKSRLLPCAVLVSHFQKGFL